MTPPSPNPPISIVLVRPREQGNIGSVARAMANMGLADLILIEPAATLGGVAKGFGVGGWHILEKCRRFSCLAEALAPFSVAAGTSSGRKRSLRDHPILDARALAEKIRADQISAAQRGAPHSVALVFGPEDNGLKKDELDLCDLLVRISCAAERPTLNLAQAVLLIAYELHVTGKIQSTNGSPTPGPAAAEARADPGPVEQDDEMTQVGERQRLVELTRPVVEHLGFDHPHLRESIMRDLQRLLRRAQPNRREAGLLTRLIRRAGQLERGSSPSKSRHSKNSCEDSSDHE